MIEWRQLRPGLRSKMLLLPLLLLPLPWFGYQYIRELETTLQHGQEQMVASIARALALTLNDKPQLFNNMSVDGSEVTSSNRLYVYPLTLTPDVNDGTLADWRDFRQHELARWPTGVTSASMNWHCMKAVPRLFGAINTPVFAAAAAAAICWSCGCWSARLPTPCSCTCGQLTAT